MSKTDDLGDRMKSYEAVTQSKLMRRTPIIIRVDGKSFHSFTKKIYPENDPSLKHSPFSSLGISISELKGNKPTYIIRDPVEKNKNDLCTRRS